LAIRPTEAEDVPTYRTLAEAVDGLTRRGFTEVFRVQDGRLGAAGRDEVFRPQDLTINEVYRFEGISDPDDMEVVYAISSASGVRGTLADAFGVYSDPAKTAALEGVPIRRNARSTPERGEGMLVT
jgi:hypothetical protein